MRKIGTTLVCGLLVAGCGGAAGQGDAGGPDVSNQVGGHGGGIDSGGGAPGQGGGGGPTIDASTEDRPPPTDGGPDLPRPTDGGPELPPLPDGGPELPPLPDGGPELPPLPDGGPIFDALPVPDGAQTDSAVGDPCSSSDYGKRRCVGSVAQICTYPTGVIGTWWQTGRDCSPGGGGCYEGQCIGGCTAGAKYCASVLYQRVCGLDGQWTSTACPGNAPCSNGACWVCTTGNRQCRANVVQECRIIPSPASWTDTVTCPNGCVGGTCTGDPCTSGATRCKGATVQACDGSGNWQDGETCALGCTSGACDRTCLAYTEECLGPTSHHVCSASGEWEAPAACPGGCSNGACAKECTAFVQECTTPTSHRSCSVIGFWEPSVECVGVCNAGTCTTCRPGALSCSSSYQTTCTDAGEWGAPQICAHDCAADGHCRLCQPGAGQCSGAVRQVCNDGGTAWVDAETCPFVCGSSACGGQCKPGTVTCSGTLRQVCSDGSGGYLAGTWMPQTCAGGCGPDNSCWDCLPGAVTCSSDKIATCDSTGRYQSAATGCPMGCRSGACVSGDCAPGASRCAGDQSQYCAGDGSWHNGTYCLGGCLDGTCQIAPECATLRGCCSQLPSSPARDSCNNIAATGSKTGCQTTLDSLRAQGACF